jgi:membrane fusion protein (multidrug efflux system)
MNVTEEIKSMQEPEFETAPEVAKRKRPNPVVLSVVAIIALAAVFKGYQGYSFGLTHVDTDDAYVTGDLIGISPNVSGIVTELKVEDGDFVKKGQVIAIVDPSTAKAELAQAEANLQAVETQVPQAKAELAFAQLSTSASIQKSQAALSSQSARIAGSKLQVSLSRQTVASQLDQAGSQLEASRATAAQADASVDSARAALTNAQQAVQTADRSAEAARSATAAAKADADRAGKDLERYRNLVDSEAISRQQYDTALATSQAAQANLDAAKQRADASESQAQQSRAGVQQAQAQLQVALKQAEAAKKQIQVAQAGVGLARASRTTVGIQDTNVKSSEGQEGQDVADLATSQAGLQQVVLRQKQIATTQAQVQQALAAVDQAKVHLRDTVLTAPSDGYVVKHTVNVGTSVTPGQTIATITRGADVWVMANFKETQLEGVASGQPVEIEVDAYPGHRFRGHVLSVLRATGAATTLLPPDNSTGNFTKVVQRVPVKISIDAANASEADLLRQGMSVTATIDTAHKGSL